MRMVYRRFHEFTVDELYDVLEVRSRVFVVEQRSIYLDLDGLDQEAVHLICYEGDRIVGLLRILKPGKMFKEACIGRIIAVDRGKGIGKAMMTEAIRYIRDVMGEKAIRIEAQVQARRFYEKLGFVVDSDEFDDGGIPHREMLLLL
ncbi:MAG: GNAT family N-acetyltransferase [archaeon]|nr:GNAT family N-acetyltransferase [archaeon]